MNYLKVGTMVVAGGCVLGLSVPAHAQVPNRDGFTLEVGFGLALTTISPDVGEGETRFGIAPVSLSLGGFLSPDVALMARAAGTTYFVDVGGDTEQINNSFYGAVVQYWPADEFFVAGGVGFAVLDDNPFLGSTNIRAETGFGFTARGGWSFATSRNGSWALAYEFYPMFYEPATLFGHSLIIQYQLF